MMQCRVLIAEDDPPISQLLSDILVPCRYMRKSQGCIIYPALVRRHVHALLTGSVIAPRLTELR